MLTPIQLQQVREKIILARHPECKTIEEAIEKEFVVGSLVLCHQEMIRDVGPAQDYIATVCEIEIQEIDEKTYEPLYEEVKITSEFNAYQVDSIAREKYRQSHKRQTTRQLSANRVEKNKRHQRCHLAPLLRPRCRNHLLGMQRPRKTVALGIKRYFEGFVKQLNGLYP